MTRSRRPFAISSATVLCALLVGAQLIGSAAGAADFTRITVAANVTLRRAPSPGAAAVAQLPLGTEVSDAGPAGLDKTWFRVKLGDGREGWLLASLTKPLDPVWRWPTFDTIIANRLGRKGDGFPANVELVAFIERVAPQYTDADGRARLELSRVRALSATMESIPKGAGSREPYASWLASRRTQVLYDEPGGRWMLANGPLWETHARLSSTTSGDDFAWFAVTSGLSGECEGYLTCYVEARNRLYGEYLRRHPFGRRVAESVSTIRNTADQLTAPVTTKATYEFDGKRDCRALTVAVDGLTAAVQGTRTEGKDAALKSLGILRKMCQ